eukprot:m.191387 g.191387  ORF g.191387 m.191387 type:complete len:568 (-) comp32430_c0_seq2:306-2009(-)
MADLDNYPVDVGIPPGIRDLTVNVSTNESAQRWFERGYAWAAGFNRQEAAYCFTQAVELDPNCTMGYWGIAMVHGPDYNNSEKSGYYHMAAQETTWPSMHVAVDAVEKAKQIIANKSDASALPQHNALILALDKRYEWPVTETTPALAVPYAEHMENLVVQFPNDTEVAITAAEAVLCLSPWNLYNKSKEINSFGIRAKAQVDHGLKTNPTSPWLCHLKVHLNEMGPLEMFDWHSANSLRKDASRIDGIGHLMHMPTHLDIQVGSYKDAWEWNERAYKVDAVTIKATGRSKFWVGYYVHNIEFCAWAAMYGANKSTALRAAAEMNIALPEKLIENSELVQTYFETYTMVELMVFIRFGMWDSILETSFKTDRKAHLFHTLFLHFARGIAFGVKNDVFNAHAEQKKFLDVLATVTFGLRKKHNIDGVCIGEIARDVLAGEILYREQKYDEAFAVLREGVAKSDNLAYDEPHGWYMSVRQTLGALLTEQQMFEEASRLYTEDLIVFPNNVWSLSGLATCYTARGDPRVDDVRARLAVAANNADIVVGASCACALKQWDGSAVLKRKAME